MIPSLLETVARFPLLRVAVVGEAMLDAYLVGTSSRLSREAPAPIVDVQEIRDAPGGAGNTAANLRAMGADTSLFSVIGDDPEGDRLIDALARYGVSTEHVLRVRGRRSLSKQRVVAHPQMLLRFDLGDGDAIDAGAEEMLLARLRRGAASADALVVSDYAYGLLTPRIIDALGTLQRSAPRVMVVDARDVTAYRRAAPTAVKPNHDEARRIIGERSPGDGDRAEQVLAHADRLLEQTGARVVAVTLDTDGAVMIERGGSSYRTYADPAVHSRAAGAGDTFTAALALSLAAGADVPVAAEIASAACRIVVRRDGTTVCSADELRAAITEGGKVLDREALRSVMHAQRQTGRRIVFTNGCFDLMHRGHVTYLSQAKALGDLLVVGLNADESVRRLKGEGRPVSPLEDRAQVLAALSCVDYVVPFEEDTPEALIRTICPDVYAKGADYTIERLPEARLVEALGGEVRLLEYVENHSTSSMIHRIQSSQERAAP